ncbi:unnamed protein product [Schistocephalus solidus]|uniref:Retrotrans_gag domain-containing protein n=1 Tax=Schistocephalus solidus TaxID=70667 RepID=A0A183S914_SCHSO|nr:unnamed protein product [Schistocephalus solidus]
MAQRVVAMTPRTKGNIKIIQVERTNNLDVSQVYHTGSGHLNGIVINKETQSAEPETESQDMQLEFTCLMHNNRTADSHAESRRLKFWFLDKTERPQRLTDSYDFFKDLVNQGTFPKDYVGFIKRMLKQLQSDHYPSLRRVDLDIIPLEPSSQEAFVPGLPVRLKPADSPMSVFRTGYRMSERGRACALNCAIRVALSPTRFSPPSDATDCILGGSGQAEEEEEEGV